MQLQETLMDLKRITFKGTQAVGSRSKCAQNVSQSSKIGFPQNIITIAAAIGQGISIISSVKKAVAKLKRRGREVQPHRLYRRRVEGEQLKL